MAIHVEDHPLEYADFEGVIPRGEYGGGDVIVWDRGTWEPAKTDDPARAVADGELHAEAHGEKLQGRLVLVRRDDKPADREQWLLLHKKDGHAVPGWDPEGHPRSVISGRTHAEVLADPTAAGPVDRANGTGPAGGGGRPVPDGTGSGPGAAGDLLALPG